MSERARVAHCLARAAHDGYRVGIVDGRVRVRRAASDGREGRSVADQSVWRAELRTLDPAVVATVLEVDVAVEVAAFDDDTREAFEERAAIIEHDARLERDLAERVAWCWCSEGLP